VYGIMLGMRQVQQAFAQILDPNKKSSDKPSLFTNAKFTDLCIPRSGSISKINEKFHANELK